MKNKISLVGAVSSLAPVSPDVSPLVSVRFDIVLVTTSLSVCSNFPVVRSVFRHSLLKLVVFKVGNQRLTEVSANKKLLENNWRIKILFSQKYFSLKDLANLSNAQMPISEELKSLP